MRARTLLRAKTTDASERAFIRLGYYVPRGIDALHVSAKARDVVRVCWCALMPASKRRERRAERRKLYKRAWNHHRHNVDILRRYRF